MDAQRANASDQAPCKATSLVGGSMALRRAEVLSSTRHNLLRRAHSLQTGMDLDFEPMGQAHFHHEKPELFLSANHEPWSRQASKLQHACDTTACILELVSIEKTNTEEQRLQSFKPPK